MLPHDDVGEGPAVVLLHAGIADRSMWRDHVDAIAEAGFRAVVPDLAGFGEAAVAAGEHAPWNDIALLLNELGIEHAALVGNSFGGAVALRFAVLAPHRVWALVVVAAPSPGLEPSAALEAVWTTEEEALERGDVDAALAAVVDGWTLPDAPDELRERVAAMQRRAYELQLNAPEPSEAPDPVGEDIATLGAIEAPTLVIAGGRDFPEFAEGATAIAGAITGARHELIAAAGHLVPLDRPAEFQAVLLPFLRRHAPAR